MGKRKKNEKPETAEAPEEALVVVAEASASVAGDTVLVEEAAAAAELEFRKEDTPAEVPSRKSRKPRKPQPKDIRLTARQYCRARKHRWERCAGFLHDMKGKGEKTRPEWDQLWDAFWTRPVK
jgi:hypothetical protein